MNRRGMPRFRVVAVMTLMVGVLLIPGHGRAVVYGGCGGSYSGTAACTFMPVGVSVYVSGNSSASYPVYVRVTVNDPLGRAIFGCEGIDFCLMWFSPVGTPFGVAEVVAPVGPLTCEVTTFPPGLGSYGCSSYPV